MVKNLRKLRISRGISQQQLAEVMGISQQSVNKYENYKVEPDIHALAELADYFHTTIDYLVGHIQPPGNQDFTEPELTKDEMKLVMGYRKLTKGEKESINLVIKNYLHRKTTPGE